MICESCASGSRRALHPHLHNALEFLGAVGDDFAFLHRVRHGLLNIHIFAALHGCQRDRCVPVVGGRDEDCVNILALQNFLMMNVGLGAGGLLRGHVEALLVNVAKSNDLDVGLVCRCSSSRLRCHPRAPRPITATLMRSFAPMILDQAGREAKAAVISPVFLRNVRRETEPGVVLSCRTSARTEISSETSSVTCVGLLQKVVCDMPDARDQKSAAAKLDLTLWVLRGCAYPEAPIANR